MEHFEEQRPIESAGFGDTAALDQIAAETEQGEQIADMQNPEVLPQEIEAELPYMPSVHNAVDLGLKQFFGILAMTRGAHWDVGGNERTELSKAIAQVIYEYAPTGFNSVWLNLAMVSTGVVGMPLLSDIAITKARKERARQDAKQAAEHAKSEAVFNES